MTKSKYINGDKSLGVDYDFRAVNKLFKSLKTPPEVYSPLTCPLDTVQYAMILSGRGTGKTTQWLLYGLCMYRLYGTQIQYVRQTDDDIAPRNSKDLFSVIEQYGYISKLTDGRYNAVVYKSRRWYLAEVDDNGTIIERDTEHFMFMCSIQKQSLLKSSYNAPLGDLLIFDEFISNRVLPNEFLDFMNLISTIFRGRHSPKVVMLANTINRESDYFHEFEIYDDVHSMQLGDSKRIVTELGTAIYLELYNEKGEVKRKARRAINRLFFGFRNSELASITGEEWSMRMYQHIPSDEFDSLISNIYVEHHGRFLRVEIVNNRRLGVCAYVHWANRTYPDSIIITDSDYTDPRQEWCCPKGELGRLWDKLIKNHRFFFASNDCGSFLKNFFSIAGTKFREY